MRVQPALFSHEQMALTMDHDSMTGFPSQAFHDIPAVVLRFGFSDVCILEVFLPSFCDCSCVAVVLWA